MDHTEKQVPTVEGGNSSNGTDHIPGMIDDDPALLARAEVLRGKYPSHERIRLVRPSRPSFKQISPGMLQATDTSTSPRKGAGRVLYHVKRTLIGAPIANSEAEHERLTKFKALAVLSSDAISSVAYATEACLLIFVQAGAGSQSLLNILPISIAIVALLTIVAISYRQTIPAYPSGGGSYIVAKDNLGMIPGLIAAASLLIDYVLTVSVSVASGVLNFAALFGGKIDPYLVAIEVGLVIFITIVNLRGVRESGSFFAIPTYFFIFSAFVLIIGGLIKGYVFQHQPFMASFPYSPTTQPVTFFLIMRAFASGCSAMTGVEAISNGVPAFQKPETKNAAKTLTAMALILGALFIGITMLTLTYAPNIHLDPTGSNTLIAQISSQVFSKTPFAFMFYVFQIATLLILVLAANTSYADFPRLASLLARDNFLPHQFAFRGDRLAFSTGIVFLAILSSSLLIALNGDISRLIDLYAVGVFMSFTLSQTGMVRHWWRLRASEPGWQRRLAINATGAVVTLLVALIIAVTKFTSGAWIVVILIPVLVLVFMAIHSHYRGVEQQRTTSIPAKPADVKHLFVVPIAGMDRVSIQSLAYARSILGHVIAVHIAIDDNDAHKVRQAWENWAPNLAPNEKTELVIIESPYRSLSRPLLNYIDTVHELYPEYTLTVLLPEFIVGHWWEHFLHNQTALQLKAALLFRPGIVVTNVPQHLPHRGRR